MGTFKTATSPEILEQIRKYLEQGDSDAEAARKVGINGSTISRWRKKGYFPPSKYFRGGEQAKRIDIDRVKLPELPRNAKIDGTPNRDYSPAFEDDGNDLPFAELVEIKAESPKPTWKPVIAEVSGKYFRVIFGAHNEIEACFDFADIDLTKELDSISQEVQGIRDYLAANM